MASREVPVTVGDCDFGLHRSSANTCLFPSTHWSIILSARAASCDADKALDHICRKYWQPLYAYVRRRGRGPEDAEDLTQEFLARFIEKRYLGLADPQRGRFRSFLLTAMKHFLQDEWARAHAVKRGGGRIVISLEMASAFHWVEPSSGLTPEKVYEQHWCEALLNAVLVRLTDEYEVNGKRARFETLKRFLWGGDGSVTYAQIAQQLSMTEDAVKTAVHRLRLRFAECLRDEIAQTVSSPEELEDELRWLRTAFA